MSLAVVSPLVRTPLPVPARERWQPLRSGLLNLYKYDHEEFWFDDGHLLLRGNNGTGKSRVLALQLPFLLDGEVTPARFEPDGDPAKRMEWNLLMNRHEDRVGYTWLELGRRTESGEPEYFTIGCGLSATQGQTGVSKWFFVTRRRLGESVFLQGDAGHPLNRERLREALGADGEVFTTAQQYRDAVDAKLFGLGRHRYEALVNLLIQLRKPQLSRALDQNHLAGALREALPPLPQKVIDDIADAFRALERERYEMDSFKAAAAAVDRFLETYRRYVQAAVRQRSDLVRSTHTDYDEAQRTLRESSRRLAEDERALAETLRALDDATLSLGSARAQLAALEESEAAQDAKTLVEREQRAAQSSEHERSATAAFERHGAALQTRAREVSAAQMALEISTAELEQQRGRTRDAATEAAFDEQALAIQTNLESADKAIADRQRALTMLRKLAGILAGARRDLESVQKEQALRSSELEDALANESKTREAFENAREALFDALEKWHGSLRVLEKGSFDDLSEQLVRWCEERTGAFPLQAWVSERHSAALEFLHRERSTEERRKDELRRAVSEGQARRQKLLEGTTTPPPAPHTRSDNAREIGVPGAPLWRLCDFHPFVSDQDRAGLEAALEASGLLDAWLGPEGLVVSAGVHDAFIFPTDRLPEGQTRLSHYLSPAIDSADAAASVVSAERVQKVLEATGGCEGAGLHWVDARGTFQLGPLAGSWAKPRAEHIGHAAREEARRSALARLDEELRGWNVELEAVETRLRALTLRQSQAKQEVSQAPSGDATAATGARWDAAAELVTTRRRRVAEAETKVSAARERKDAAERTLAQSATDVGLSAWTDRLDELDRRGRELERQLEKLRRAIDKAHLATAERTRRRQELEQAKEAATEAEAALQVARQMAAEARASYETLKAKVGQSVEALSADLAEAKRRGQEAESRIVQLSQTKGTLQGSQAGRKEALQRAQEDLGRATDHRNQALQALAQLGDLGFLAMALGKSELELTQDWTATRGLEVARQLEAALSTVEHSAAAWERLGNQMQGRFQTLMTELGVSGLFQPDAAMPHGVFHVQVRFQSRQLRMDELRSVLGNEVMARQTLLDQRERELLENHLLGEVASHLHELLHQATGWVRMMNQELEHCPTSTGMSLRFRWEPAEEVPAGLLEALKLLRRNQATWSLEQRTQVGAFLKTQMDRARADAPDATWQEHLTWAFDYRAWHTFTIERHQDGRWQKLTRRTHGTGSGGEKAIALTLPQFAAAAAHYRSAAPTAPRLILLDEAFVGIDSDMRSKCMGLLSTFDLDFMMTSEREWACYASLPGVAICQLTSHPGLDAVHVTRFVWNGKARGLANVNLPPAKAPALEETWTPRG